MSTITPPTGAKETGACGENKTRVTISDVAQALGLTKGTVSRALNGYSDIADVTRLRVARTAELMGYRPLAHAQAIRTGRVKALGLVLQISQHDADGPFLTDFLAGVTAAAGAEGWTLAVATANSDSDMLGTLGRMRAERKADGFILPRTKVDDARVSYLRETGTPFILYGRTRDDRECPWFDILGEDAIRNAVERLAAMGHRRIGFVNGGAEFNFNALRLLGYKRGLMAAGLALDLDLIIDDARRAIDGDRATRRLLAQPTPPTAIVYATDVAALGAYSAARDLGITLGTELSVIAYDGIPEGAYATPGLTTYAVDSRKAGERLAQMLIRRIQGAAAETLREFEPARLIKRGSDRPPNITSEELAARLACADNAGLSNNHPRET